MITRINVMSEWPRKYEVILTRFPERSEEIKQLMQNSPAFREMCDDYLWVSNRLADSGSHGECKMASEQDYYRTMLLELEVEIEQSLQSASDPPATLDSPGQES